MPASPDRGTAIYRRLMSYALNYWYGFAGAVMGMVVVAATETGMAALIKPMLDGSFVDKDPTTIRLIPFVLVSVFLVRGIGSFSAQYGMNWVGRNVIRDLRREIFARLLSLPVSFHDTTPSGQLTAKLIYDVEQVAQASTSAITIIVRDNLTVIGLLGWMLYLNWLLSMFLLVVAPLIVLVVWYIGKRFRRISKKIQDSVGDVSRITQEAIEGHRVIKVFGGQEYEQENFAQANEVNRSQNMKLITTSAAAVPINQLLGAMAFAAVLFVATQEPMLEKITVGTFTSFIVALGLLFPAIKRLTSVNVMLQKGITAAQSIFALMDQAIEPDTGTRRLSRARGEVEYRQVSFAYDQSKGEVLKQVSFTAMAGQTLAFVGKSGAGKSTLVNLLPRFYELTQGNILLDGEDISNLRLADLRNQVSLVSQDIRLFNDTIAHNIAYSRIDSCSEQDIIGAAEAAHAMEFIGVLPDGINTLVGENGVLLSGGQRQRVAIARALLKNAPLLILDEATSALDTESERHIQAALAQLMFNRTTLVIAHRLSTIEDADLILVLDNGRIVEQGKHAELLAQRGIYAHLYKIQFKE